MAQLLDGDRSGFHRGLHFARRADILGGMVLSHQQHVMACALLVEKQQGKRAGVYVAEQIGRLALEGDAAGVAMWKEIAVALDRLNRAGRGGNDH